LINPENSMEIAGAMIKLITDDQLLEKLKNQGLIRSNKFSWKVSAEKLLQILNKYGIISSA